MLHTLADAVVAVRSSKDAVQGILPVPNPSRVRGGQGRVLFHTCPAPAVLLSGRESTVVTNDIHKVDAGDDPCSRQVVFLQHFDSELPGFQQAQAVRMEVTQYPPLLQPNL